VTQWRHVVGYAGLYEISDDGRLRSLPRKGAWSGVREIRPQMHSEGYHVVRLCRDGVPRGARIHRLVAQAFLPGFTRGCQIDHVNGVRTDNRVSNLRVATQSQNMMNVEREAGATGVVGVCWAKDRNRYVARIKVGGKVIYLGKHRRLEDAVRARKEAERLHFKGFARP